MSKTIQEQIDELRPKLDALVKRRDDEVAAEIIHERRERRRSDKEQLIREQDIN